MKWLFRRNHALIVALLGLPMLVGCQTTGGGPQRVVADRTIDTSHPNATLVIGSSALVGTLTVLDPRVRRTGAFPQGQVTVQNLSDERLTLEYRFNWEDRAGFVVSDDRLWHRITLTPREVRRIDSTGQSDEAETMVFTVRYPDDIYIDYERRNPRTEGRY